jgi:alpha-tubulin suppressor-like RCC1 family protein
MISFTPRSEPGSSGNRNSCRALCIALAAVLGLPAMAGSAQEIVTQAAAGSDHSCAVVAGGRVKCWGGNSDGQLGDGTFISRTTPVDVVGLSVSVTAVATGGFHSCALTAAGGVKCWGRNYYGQLGDGADLSRGHPGSRNTPVDVVGLPTGVKKIVAGEQHTCALTTGGAMLCWGADAAGQLGDGTALDRSTPAQVSELTFGVVAIAAGSANSAVIIGQPRVRYWGRDGMGMACQPAYCVWAPMYSNVPKDAPIAYGGVTSVAVAGGGYSADYYGSYSGDINSDYSICALAAGGRALCWAGKDNPSDHPATEISGLPPGVTAISMGGHHGCVLASGGTAQCWGTNNHGQLGWGLPGGLTAIAAGGAHTCAVTAVGEAICWGANGRGQLGDGTTTDRGTPVAVVGLSNPASGLTTVVEFYAAALDHYFITWLPNEIAALDAGSEISGWVRTGYSFTAYKSAQPGTSPVCRFYIPPGLGDSHFFGRGTEECTATRQKYPRFVLEAPAFMQMYLPTAGECPADTTPVYRVYSNRADTNHRYTTDRAVREQMIAKGWLAEGDGPDTVAMCAP